MKIILRALSLLAAFALLPGPFVWGGPAGYGTALAQNSAGAAAGTAKQGKDSGERDRSTGTQLATSELLRIEQEVQRLNQRIAELALEVEAAGQTEPILPRAQALLTRAPVVCDQPEEVKQQFFVEVDAIIDQARELVGDRPGPWNSSPESWQALCAAPGPHAVLQEIHAQLAAMGNAGRERAEAERQLAELTERREEVLREMTDDLAGASVADNIPWLMLIIFGVGAATLAGVKLFDAAIQQELIASGQIVQFVTILILLGVILALGLAQRLQAETLGTLLGGLAGYVLSQGVGRQAQQQVLNDIKSAAAAGPPPPPPPETPVSPEPPGERP